VSAACSFSASNLSGWSPTQQFNTDQYCASPYNLMVQNIYTTSSSASIRFQGQLNTTHLVMFKDLSSSNWDTLSLSSGIVSNLTSLSAGVNVTLSVSGSLSNLVFTGLESGTTYEWQVISLCAPYNISSSVSGSSFTTSPECMMPTGLLTSAISATSATLNWSATVAHHYALRGRVQGSSTWLFEIPFLSNANRTVYNLIAGESYEWQVRTVCSSDTSEVSAWSVLDSFNTLVNCDTPPTNLSTTNIDLNIATLNWDAESSAQAYEVRFRKTTDPWSANVHSVTSNTELNKTGLSPGSNYLWSVKSICDTSNNVSSQWTAWQTFTTHIACAPPNNLMVLNTLTTLNSASLRWYGPMNINYNVIFKENASSNWDTVIVNGTSVSNITLLPFGITINASTSGSESNVTISGLSSSTTYEWQIISACSGTNMSLAISGATFTTVTSCDIPSNLTSTPLVTSATIAWNAVAGAVKYDVRKKTSWRVFMGIYK
jgi:hypothetical protein